MNAKNYFSNLTSSPFINTEHDIIARTEDMCTTFKFWYESFLELFFFSFQTFGFILENFSFHAKDILSIWRQIFQLLDEKSHFKEDEKRKEKLFHALLSEINFRDKYGFRKQKIYVISSLHIMICTIGIEHKISCWWL